MKNLLTKYKVLQVVKIESNTELPPVRVGDRLSNCSAELMPNGSVFFQEFGGNWILTSKVRDMKLIDATTIHIATKNSVYELKVKANK